MKIKIKINEHGMRYCIHDGSGKFGYAWAKLEKCIKGYQTDLWHKRMIKPGFDY